MATNGLFESQGDVLAREQMTRRGTVDTRAALRGSLFNLGSAVGTAGINVFGGDGRSQEQMRAEKVENIFQQVQLGNPQSMMKGVNAFRDAGFAEEAMLMMGKIPQAVKQPKTYGELQSTTLQVTDDSGNRTDKVVYGQFDSEGQFHSKYNVTSSGDAKPTNGRGATIRSNVFSEITDNESTTKFLNTKLTSLLNQEQWRDLDIETVEDSGIYGKIANIAAQSKQEQRAKFFQMKDQYLKNNGTEMSQNQSDALANQLILPNRVALDQALQTYITSGNFRKDLSSSGPLEPTISPDPTDTSTIQDLNDDTITEQERVAARGLASQRIGQPVVEGGRDQMKGEQGDPSNSGFRLDQLTFDQAGQLFGSGASDEQIVQAIAGMGKNLPPEVLANHSVRWQTMRETPEAVNMFIYGDVNGSQGGLMSTEDDGQRESRNTIYLDSIPSNSQKFFQTVSTFMYLRRLYDKKENRPVDKGRRIRGRI